MALVDKFIAIKKQLKENAQLKFTIMVVIISLVALASFEMGKKMGVKGTQIVISEAAKHGNPIMFTDGPTFICNEIEDTTAVKYK